MEALGSGPPNGPPPERVVERASPRSPRTKKPPTAGVGAFSPVFGRRAKTRLRADLGGSRGDLSEDPGVGCEVDVVVGLAGRRARPGDFLGDVDEDDPSAVSLNPVMAVAITAISALFARGAP